MHLQPHQRKLLNVAQQVQGTHKGNGSSSAASGRYRKWTENQPIFEPVQNSRSFPCWQHWWLNWIATRIKVATSLSTSGIHKLYHYFVVGTLLSAKSRYSDILQYFLPMTFTDEYFVSVYRAFPDHCILAVDKHYLVPMRATDHREMKTDYVADNSPHARYLKASLKDPSWGSFPTPTYCSCAPLVQDRLIHSKTDACVLLSIRISRMSRRRLVRA